MSEIRMKKGEPVDRALRRLKRKLDREGTIREIRVRKTYEKPSVRRKRKAKEARQNRRRY